MDVTLAVKVRTLENFSFSLFTTPRFHHPTANEWLDLGGLLVCL